MKNAASPGLSNCCANTASIRFTSRSLFLSQVAAVWAMRRNAHTAALRCQLRDARDFGLDTIDHIISVRTEYTEDFRKDYFGWHIHYHLGTDEKRGIARFVELLRKHGFDPVYEPQFVS